MADRVPITLIKKIYDIINAAAVTDGKLSDVKSVDWGGALPPQMSVNLPSIFITPRSSSHPEVYAARGAYESYWDHISFWVNIYTDIIKDSAGIPGYQAALIQAWNIYYNLKELCQDSKEWDGLCSTSLFAEEEEAEYGMAEWGDGAIAFAISAPLECRGPAASGTTKVVDCDGQYYAVAGDLAVHDVTTEDISVSAWVKIQSGSTGVQGIVGHSSGADGYDFGIDANGVLRLLISDYVLPFDFNTATVTGTTDLRDGEWHHVAGKIDRSYLNVVRSKVFVDGVDDTASVAVVGTLTTLTASQYFTIGAHDNVGNWNLYGRVADVRIYIQNTDVWSDSEIAYQAANAFDYSLQAGKISEYWRCDEGSGLILQGSADNSLTLNSVAAWVEDSPL